VIGRSYDELIESSYYVELVLFGETEQLRHGDNCSPIRPLFVKERYEE
jgi:hypothetical protein